MQNLVSWSEKGMCSARDTLGNAEANAEIIRNVLKLIRQSRRHFGKKNTRSSIYNAKYDNEIRQYLEVVIKETRVIKRTVEKRND